MSLRDAIDQPLNFSKCTATTGPKRKCNPYAISSPQKSLYHAITTFQELAETRLGYSWRLSQNDVSPTKQRPAPATAADLARRTRLQHDLEVARTFKDFRRIQQELYDLDFDRDADDERRASLFNVELVNGRTSALEAALNDDDVVNILHLLRTQLTRDLGGMCNPELYHHPGIATEENVKRYQRTVKDSINRVVTACQRNDRRLRKSDVRHELETTLKSFGRTALLCSGGGTMGMAHIGVIKALRDANQLPDIVAGSSAGAIVCAVLCTRLDTELPIVLEEFCQGDLAVFVGGHETPGWSSRARHLWEKGALFDSANLKRVMKQHLGDMTFGEAYSRTGKVLNITVSSGVSSKLQSYQQVLNYRNSANVVIWSAVVASCALPLAFEAGTLMIKDPVSKELKPHSAAQTHIDGSIAGDIPISRLEEEFGCNYFIVAQANPHVLTCWALKDMIGETLVGQLVEKMRCNALEDFAGFVAGFSIVGQAVAGIITQRYQGDVTIVPPLTLGGLYRILSNPTPEFMEASKRTGESATWPYLSMIKNHRKIELALERANMDVSAACHFSDSQSDLRRMQLEENAKSKCRRRSISQSLPRTRFSAIASRIFGSRTPPQIKETTPAARPTISMAKSVFQAESTDHNSSDSSSSDTTMFKLGSDDESNDDESITSLSPPMEAKESDSDTDPEPPLLRFHSAPSSPRPTAQQLTSPTRTRSHSPAFTPMSLMMTPADERPNSPESTRGRMDVPPASPSAVRAAASGQAQSVTPGDLLGVKIRAPRSVRHKRSSSTGHLGIPQ